MNVHYPRWNPASIASRAISTVEADVTSEGLITIAFLGGQGWGSSHRASKAGEFHGVIIPTTPSSRPAVSHAFRVAIIAVINSLVDVFTLHRPDLSTGSVLLGPQRADEVRKFPQGRMCRFADY
jgi:hypothetical protein